MEKQLQFDDAIDELYRRHDGGQDTRKGVQRAADYPDRNEIPDFDAAAMMVYLDIYRGTPTGKPDEFVFAPDGILARSAFQRMLLRTRGADMEEVKQVSRSEDGITCGEALEQVNLLLGSAKLPPAEAPEAPLTRALAVELVARALQASRGDGSIPYVFKVETDQSLSSLELPENSVVVSPDGTLVTLTVDGVFMPLTGGYRYQGADS